MRSWARFSDPASLPPPDSETPSLRECAAPAGANWSRSTHRRTAKPKPTSQAHRPAAFLPVLVTEGLQVQLRHDAPQEKTQVIRSQHVAHARRQQSGLLRFVIEKFGYRVASLSQYRTRQPEFSHRLYSRSLVQRARGKYSEAKPRIIVALQLTISSRMANWSAGTNRAKNVVRPARHTADQGKIRDP